MSKHTFRARDRHTSACLVTVLGATLLAFALLPANAWAAKPDATLTADRDAAAAAGNPGLALAYDDVISGVNEFHTPAKRAELSRNRHDDFTGFVVSETGKLGPLTDENAEATFGLLLALISEARRGDERRVADLAPVIPETLQPLMEAAAARMWVKVEALLAGHEYVRAVQLGDAVVSVAAGDGRYVTRLSEARALAAEHYAALARSEPAGAPGARLVDARMAALFGGPGPDGHSWAGRSRPPESCCRRCPRPTCRRRARRRGRATGGGRCGNVSWRPREWASPPHATPRATGGS